MRRLLAAVLVVAMCLAGCGADAGTSSTRGNEGGLFGGKTSSFKYTGTGDKLDVYENATIQILDFECIEGRGEGYETYVYGLAVFEPDKTYSANPIKAVARDITTENPSFKHLVDDIHYFRFHFDTKKPIKLSDIKFSSYDESYVCEKLSVNDKLPSVLNDRVLKTNDGDFLVPELKLHAGYFRTANDVRVDGLNYVFFAPTKIRTQLDEDDDNYRSGDIFQVLKNSSGSFSLIDSAGNAYTEVSGVIYDSCLDIGRRVYEVSYINSRGYPDTHWNEDDILAEFESKGLKLRYTDKKGTQDFDIEL